ncbi:MAG: ammonium transporter [Acidobacteria bacterium]|nr:ammonium transporter [Acidobacteriota bacterium]MBI3423145.1 ammonium transporter [Acidobacteriota bacterium]
MLALLCWGGFNARSNWLGMTNVQAQTADPSGANTGAAGDITAKDAGKPTLDEVAATVGHNKIAINFIWVLVAGFLVMFMQAGFALAETGFCRAKNAAHTMSMNLMVYAVGMIGFWISGFALMMGGIGSIPALGTATSVLNHEFTITLAGKTFGLFGLKGFFLSFGTYDVAVFGLFLFAMVFMDTAATIPTGAMAERWKFSAFIIFSFFMGALVYPIFGNWVWGGGWLATLGSNFGLGHGFVDYAGSSVVHMTGGVTAFVGAKLLGPRIGKFTREGKPVALPGHDLPMALLGVFILAFGWFGFNAGSSLAGGDLRISVIATNTMLASATGAFASALYVWKRLGKPDPSMIANGMLAGLVAITAPCAFVTSWAAALIGVIAGVLVVESILFFEQKMKIDDPVGAISVHGVNGFWGVVSLGLFADGTYGDGYNAVTGGVKGLFYGDAKQFIAQLIGPVVNIVFVGLAFYLIYKLVDKLVGHRVDAEVEIGGLDLPEMGALAYPDFQVLSGGPGSSFTPSSNSALASSENVPLGVPLTEIR